MARPAIASSTSSSPKRSWTGRRDELRRPRRGAPGQTSHDLHRIQFREIGRWWYEKGARSGFLLLHGQMQVSVSNPRLRASRLEMRSADQTAVSAALVLPQAGRAEKKSPQAPRSLRKQTKLEVLTLRLVVCWLRSQSRPVLAEVRFAPGIVSLRNACGFRLPPGRGVEALVGRHGRSRAGHEIATSTLKQRGPAHRSWR